MSRFFKNSRRFFAALGGFVLCILDESTFTGGTVLHEGHVDTFPLIYNPNVCA